MYRLTVYGDENFSNLSAALEDEFESDCPLAMEIITVDKEQIKRLNAEYREIDKVTDVLSFPTLEGIKDARICGEHFPYDFDERGNLFIGSIVICSDVAREQAEEYGHTYERELYYLAVHGACHLLGYDHMEEDEKLEMRVKEERIMKRLNLSRE